MTTIGIQFITTQETMRANRANEAIKQEQNRLTALDVETRQKAQAETERHQRVTESLDRISAQGAYLRGLAANKTVALNEYMYKDTGQQVQQALAGKYGTETELNKVKSMSESNRAQELKASTQLKKEQAAEAKAKAGKVTSEKFANYTKGVESIVKSAGGVVDIVDKVASMISKTKASKQLSLFE